MTTLEKIRYGIQKYLEDECINEDEAQGIFVCIDIIDKYASEECDRDCEHCAYLECPKEPCEDNRLYIKVYADLEPQEKAEKLYQICEEEELKEVYEVLGEYCDIEPSEDAVSREAVLDAFAEYVRSGYADSENDFSMYCRIVNELPSVQPKAKPGRWKMKGDSMKCSVCGAWVENHAPRKFCGNCGAEMKGDAE